MSVVAAFKLNDLVPFGVGAGEPDRAHDRLCPGTHQPDLLDGRNRLGDHLCETDLKLSRCPVARAVVGGACDRLDDRWRSVPQEHRSPGQDIVNETISVHVIEAGTLRPFDEERLSPYGTECANMTVDPTWDVALRLGKQLF